MEKRIRNHSIHLRLSDEELKQLNKQCKKCHMRKQTYILQLIKGVQPREFPPMEYFEHLSNIRSLVVSMSEIAVKAKESGEVDVGAYWDNVAKLQELYDPAKES